MDSTSTSSSSLASTDSKGGRGQISDQALETPIKLAYPNIVAVPLRCRHHLVLTPNFLHTPKITMVENTVYSKGIIHGLPCIHNPTNNLTALVTGATGLSGYHLVKLLASSSRWSRIYCLSSRTPPENFWRDLGDDAARVEHTTVDFMEEPAKISTALRGKTMSVKQIDWALFISLTNLSQRLCLLLLL